MDFSRNKFFPTKRLVGQIFLKNPPLMLRLTDIHKCRVDIQNYLKTEQILIRHMNQNVENLQLKKKIFYRCKNFQNMNKKYKIIYLQLFRVLKVTV